METYKINKFDKNLFLKKLEENSYKIDGVLPKNISNKILEIFSKENNLIFDKKQHVMGFTDFDNKKNIIIKFYETKIVNNLPIISKKSNKEIEIDYEKSEEICKVLDSFIEISLGKYNNGKNFDVSSKSPQSYSSDLDYSR